MRVNTTFTKCDEKETDQVTFDSIAELLASDDPIRNYKSGTIATIVSTGLPTALQVPITYVLIREFNTGGPVPLNALISGNGGIWLLVSAGGGIVGVVAFFATHQADQYPAAGPNAIGPHGTVALATAGSGDSFVAPRAGTIGNLRLRIVAAEGGTNTANANADFFLYVNGNPTTIKVTLNAGVATANLVDATHTAPVAAGDEISFVVDATQWLTGDITNYSLSAEIA